MTIGEKIYQLRKSKGLSQEELADELNISRQSVSLWETNQTVPQIDYLLELSKVFEVSLDELCNNKVYSNEVDVDENVLKPISSSHLEYNENIINRLIVILDKNIQRRRIIFYDLLVIGLSFILINYAYIFLSLLAVMNIIIFIIFKNKNKKTYNFLMEENRIYDIDFYENNFEVRITSKKSSGSSLVNYKEIENVIFDDDLLVVVFNHKYAVINLNDLHENKNQIINLLMRHLSKKRIKIVKKPNEKLLGLISLLLFIGCFGGLILTMVLFAIVNENYKYSFAPFAFTLNFWLFFIGALFPLASLIFGIIVNKKYSCKKNIIAGIIMTIILCLYGSMFFIFRGLISFDEEYLYEVSENINIDFPDENLFIRTYISLHSETYLKLTNEEEIKMFEEFIISSGSFDDVNNMTNSYDAYLLSMSNAYNSYCVYDVTSEYFTDRDVDQIMLLYNFETNVLLIFELNNNA